MSTHCTSISGMRGLELPDEYEAVLVVRQYQTTSGVAAPVAATGLPSAPLGAVAVAVSTIDAVARMSRAGFIPLVGNRCGRLQTSGEEIHKETRGAGLARRELAEERERRIDVRSFADRRGQECPVVRSLAGIVHRQDRVIVRIEGMRHVERVPALVAPGRLG